MTDEAVAEISEQEITLEEELSNAFDESIAEDEAEANTDEHSEEETADESDSTEATDEESEEDAGDDEPLEDEDELTAPENWSKKDQDMFEGLDDNAKEFLNRRHSQMEKALYKKTQELSGAKHAVDSIKQMLDPFRAEFEMSGIDDVGAIRQLVAAHTSLKSDPAKAIKWLADSYGVNINMPDAEPAGEVNPEIQALQNQMKELTSGQQQSAADAVTQQMEAFQNETDEAGELAHPYFNDVMPDMIGLVKAGQAKDLADAYEKSLWLNADVRKKVLAKQKEGDQVKQRAKVAKAKKAQGVNPVRSSMPGKTSKKSGGNSLRDDISAAYDQAESRNRI